MSKVATEIKSFFGGYVKNNWIDLLFVAFIVWAVATTVLQYFSKEDTDGIVNKAIAIEKKNVQEAIDETNKKSEELDKEIEALNKEMKTLRSEISESIKKREELHDAISKARSIRDIDRILNGDKGK